MAQSVLDNKRILAVDDEPDVLDVLRAETTSAAPKCLFETATTFEQARKLLASWSYDLLILDIMGVRGFDLLELATVRDIPIPKQVMLTATRSPLMH